MAEPPSKLPLLMPKDEEPGAIAPGISPAPAEPGLFEQLPYRRQNPTHELLKGDDNEFYIVET